VAGPLVAREPSDYAVICWIVRTLPPSLIRLRCQLAGRRATCDDSPALLQLIVFGEFAIMDSHEGSDNGG
jgi:hypothetical protein